MPDQSANARYRTTDPTGAEVPYLATANRRLVGLRGVYREGLPLAGWGCGRCYRNFPHGGNRRLTFARFVLHHIGKHGRFPRYLMPPARLLRLRWTVIPADERGTS